MTTTPLNPFSYCNHQNHLTMPYLGHFRHVMHWILTPKTTPNPAFKATFKTTPQTTTDPSHLSLGSQSLGSQNPNPAGLGGNLTPIVLHPHCIAPPVFLD